MQPKDQLSSSPPARAVSIAARVVILVTALALYGEQSVAGEGFGEIPSNRRITPIAELPPGPVAINSTTEPAHRSFDKSVVAHVESASEGAGGAVAAVLQTPQIGNPQLEAAIGVVQFALVPFAAGYGAITGHRRLTEQEMSDAEQNLDKALRAVAQQEHLRRLVLDDAGKQTHRQLLEADLMETRSAASLSGVLETVVEQLQLRHPRNNDKEYRLTITARARLKTAENRIVAERPYQYVSGSARFIDWAGEGALENTAQTGYRAIADQIARDFFAPERQPRLLLGDGYKPSTGIALRPVRNSLGGSSTIPTVQLVDYRLSGSGSLEILPGVDRPEVFIRAPKSKEQFSSESPTDTEWAMDGLENHRNFVVQVASCAAAIPLGLWEQTIGVVRNRSREDLSEAESMIQRVTWKHPVQQQMAEAIASDLSPRTSQRVTLRALPGTDNAAADNENSPRLSRPDLFLTDGSNAAQAAAALEARVLKVELAKTSGKHHLARLIVEAEMILVRNSDGQELCAWPVQYLSAPRRMADWVQDNGASFRKELEQCSSQIAAGVVGRLLSEGYVAPLRTPAASIAKN